MSKLYIVGIWSKVNPATGRYCKPFMIRTSQSKGTSIAQAMRNTFVGNTEFIGKVSCMSTDETEG
jgi:hypothetical protein